MELGSFSLSLAVEDLAVSQAFYEMLGFEAIDGDAERWLIMKKGEARIGLFAGMFEQNLLTFQPPNARAIEARFVEAGMKPDKACGDGDGPTHFIIRDPDGNILLFDQPPAQPVQAP